MKTVDIAVYEDPEQVESRLKAYEHYQITYLGQITKRSIEEDPYTRHEALVVRSFYRFLIQGGNRA